MTMAQNLVLVDEIPHGNPPLRVGIIGGGVSGISACKEAVELGLSPTLFEKATDLGGLWKCDGTGSVWAGLRVNISKYSCCFSDFPWPPDTPLFPTAEAVHTYIKQYAEKHDLLQYTRLDTRVVKLEQADRSWRIHWFQKGGPGEQPRGGSETFDRIIVATGVQSEPIRPNIRGLESFPGLLVHSADYPGPELFRGQRVLCVGASFSGADIARDVTTVASSVTTIARHGTWYVNRMVGRMPLDLLFYQRRRGNRIEKSLEEMAKETGDEAIRFKTKALHHFFEEVCGKPPAPLLVPDAENDETFVAITDGFMDAVREEKMRIKTVGIKRVDGNEVTFEDETTATFDAIILATGYNTELPFFSQEQLRKVEFSPKDSLQPMILHKSVWRPELPNLAFVGVYKGNYLGMCELQARWACGVFAGEISCPSYATLYKGLEEMRELRQQKPRPQFPHGDYVKYADGVAEEMGVYPGHILDDPQHPFRKEIIKCPVLPCHFRLVGSGAKPGVAMATILECGKLRDSIIWRNKAENFTGTQNGASLAELNRVDPNHSRFRQLDDVFIAVRTFLQRSAYSPYIETDFKDKTIWALSGTQSWVKLFTMQYDGENAVDLLFHTCLRKSGRALKRLVGQESARHSFTPETEGNRINPRVTWLPHC